MNDIELIYDKVKNKYNLILTNTFALDDGYTIDVPVIRGTSANARFDLYKDGDLFVFSVAFFDKTGEEKYSHTHPYDVADAIQHIEDFMSETSILERAPQTQRDKKKIGEALLEGLAEIVLMLIFFGIGALIFRLFGVNLDSSNLDFELVILFGMLAIVVVTVVIFVAFILIRPAVSAFLKWIKKTIFHKSE